MTKDKGASANEKSQPSSEETEARERRRFFATSAMRADQLTK